MTVRIGRSHTDMQIGIAIVHYGLVMKIIEPRRIDDDRQIYCSWLDGSLALVLDIANKEKPR